MSEILGFAEQAFFVAFFGVFGMAEKLLNQTVHIQFVFVLGEKAFDFGEFQGHSGRKHRVRGSPGINPASGNASGSAAAPDSSLPVCGGICRAAAADGCYAAVYIVIYAVMDVCGHEAPPGLYKSV
jgi:hypothetical protein